MGGDGVVTKTRLSAGALEASAREVATVGEFRIAASRMAHAASQFADPVDRLRCAAAAARYWLLAGEVAHALEVLSGPLAEGPAPLLIALDPPGPEPKSSDDPPMSEGPIEIRLLGSASVRQGPRDLPVPPGQPLLLLKLVAVTGEITTGECVEIMWPGAAPGVGRTRLRNVLARLRAAVGDLIVRRGELLQLGPSVFVDTRKFVEASDACMRAARAGERLDDRVVATILNLYVDDLLPADLYLPWSFTPRERLKHRFVTVLDIAVRQACAEGNVLRAAYLLEQAISSDPYTEARYLQLAEIHLDAGRSATALGVLRRAARAGAELGVRQSYAVTELEARCRGMGSSAPSMS